MICFSTFSSNYSISRHLREKHNIIEKASKNSSFKETKGQGLNTTRFFFPIIIINSLIEEEEEEESLSLDSSNLTTIKKAFLKDILAKDSLNLVKISSYKLDLREKLILF